MHQCSTRELVKHGWTRADNESELASFQNGLSIQDGCILWGNRVVIPSQRCSRCCMKVILGINRMKGLARSVVWWPWPECKILYSVTIFKKIRNASYNVIGVIINFCQHT